jgi:hypothetical protein
MKVWEHKEKHRDLYQEALGSGTIVNRGCNTAANGHVDRYQGEGLIMVNGKRYFAEGVEADGDAWSIFRGSYIKFKEAE